MYNDENNDDYKVLLMWFLDIIDTVYGLRDEQNDGDNNGMSSICDDCGKLFLILTGYRNWMRYEVNCSIYDFVMLCLCYTYVNIANYDVTISHKTYSYINCQF